MMVAPEVDMTVGEVNHVAAGATVDLLACDALERDVFASDPNRFGTWQRLPHSISLVRRGLSGSARQEELLRVSAQVYAARIPAMRAYMPTDRALFSI